MADFHWPPAEKRQLLGKRISRLDGPWKATGTATYTYDVHREGMLFGRMAVSPHAHAKIVSIDTSAAEKMPGVKAVDIILDPGKEVLWAGQEILSLAAETDDQARDAIRAVRIEFEPLTYLVSDVSPEQAGATFVQKLNEQTDSDPDAGFQQADVTHEGEYGTAVITHCCLESHGQVCEWQGDQLTVWASTQNVSGIPGELATGLNVPAANIRVITPVMGGGFGSKFGADTWGKSCAQLARKANRPVKMMLDRDHELNGAGMRPSIYAKVKVGAKRDGTITAWQSQSWGTSGPGGGNSAQLPYIFQVPYRRQHTAVHTNVGPARAWRAPNHPQWCLVTMGALDDLSAKLNMDPLDFFRKNIAKTGARSQNYSEELEIAAQLMDWKKKWQPRGKSDGPMKRGVGLSIHTWGGGANNSSCNCTINPDGSVSVSMATQDLGVGTRTSVGIVAAETLGLPLEKVQVNIGDSKLPQAGASGGSTTIGGVSSSTRLAATNALNKLLAAVAPSMGAKPEELEAYGGKIRVAANPAKSITWNQACAKLGTSPISEMGKTPAANTPERDLVSSQVAGVQMAEVTVDTETGLVHMEKMVAVQDCGLIIDLKTAESQVYGACIMGVCYALFEEKVMDQQTGKHLNADMEFYKLAGIGDIGEIVVHMMSGKGYDERGVIGLGEPPTVSPGAAISNAVANAIGVRVPTLPIRPDKVLDALAKGGLA